VPSDTRPYLSHPALHGDHLAFVAGGDLWSLRLGEGVARRLTSSAGTITHPKLSPDGSLIAFGAREDGPTAVFVMSANGGEARRLVYHPAACDPLGFTPDGTRVLFVSTLAATSLRVAEIFSVSLDGTDVRKEPLGRANAVAMDAAGRIVIGRGYQDPARWKHYRGGLAGELWAGTREPLEVKRLSSGDRAGECQPGLWGDRVTFLTDVDGTGNLWSCRIDGSDRRKHTLHAEHYVRFPSVESGRCAYIHAGDLWLLDLATDKSRKIDIDIHADVSTTRRRYVEAARFLESASPSPDGKSVLLTARGKTVALPCWRGPVKVVGDEEGVRFAHAAWLRDGKSVALVHDRSGEEEIVVRPLDGSSPERSHGRAGEGSVRRLAPSPDGKWIAVSEQAAGLFLVHCEDSERRQVDRTDSGAITELSWSPDSRWIAYARPRRYRSQILLHDVETGRSHPVTGPEFDDGHPAFDPTGRYLWFLSRRVYNPYADELQHDVAFPATTKPYCVVLAEDRPSPFGPLSADDLGLAQPAIARRHDEPGDETPRAEGRSSSADAIPEAVRIDLAGLENRVVEVPVQEGRYAGVLATAETLFLLRRPLHGMATGDDDSGKPRLSTLVGFDLGSREEKTWATEVRDARLSLDGKTLLLRGDGEIRILSATRAPATPSAPAPKPSEKAGVFDLSRVRVRIDPRAEWRQIFREAWRQQRGHFWTGSMDARDWEALWHRYEPLARRVRTRDELSDVMWDMQGELGTSHAYVVGGDEPWRPHYRTGLLGCDLEFDTATGCYRISKIHAGDTWLPGAASPLALPGSTAREGEWLLAIDGRECGRAAHPWTLLERPGPAVTLTIASSPTGEGSRDVVVAPLAQEYRCRYREWVRANQAIVDARTGGRVGYMHVPDMQVAGLVEFHRAFLWQASREALIVDVRDNGGGNVSQILLEKLNRKLHGYVKARWAEPEPLPYNTVVGPMVALCNERTGSDGDIFCQSWRQLGLGPLIGKRTWGGVIGIDRSRTLVDGGYTTQPEYAFWFRERGWEVEGNGVDPDIEVDITPVDMAADRDPQLERGIEEVLRLLAASGPGKADLPPPPNRAIGLRRG